MSRAENRFLTKKWKLRRMNHQGDKCRNPKCGICHPHKKLGNSKERNKKKYQNEKDKD